MTTSIFIRRNFQIAIFKRGVSVGVDSREEALGLLYGAVLAAAAKEETVIGAKYEVHDYKPSERTCMSWGNVEIVCDSSDVFEGGPIHTSRCLAARAAAYKFLEAKIRR